MMQGYAKVMMKKWMALVIIPYSSELGGSDF